MRFTDLHPRAQARMARLRRQTRRAKRLKPLGALVTRVYKPFFGLQQTRDFFALGPFSNVYWWK